MDKLTAAIIAKIESYCPGTYSRLPDSVQIDDDNRTRCGYCGERFTVTSKGYIRNHKRRD